MTNFLDEYDNIRPLYDKLKNHLSDIMKDLLDTHSVEIFSIEGRIKEKESIISKVSRKTYVNPSVDDIEDLCGIRIICYYESDLNKIESIIRKEFPVISGSDKQLEIDVDRFGYSSRHFIVKFNAEWLKYPTARGLENLKAEIQIRTMLMHTWAAISHKLLYKQEDDAPREIKRNLSMLSALIELADEKFDQIKENKLQYQDKISKNKYVAHDNEPLNSDNLIFLVSKYSPNRETTKENLPKVLNEIKKYDNNIGDFEKRIQECLPYIDKLESDEAGYSGESKLPMWAVEGFCRTVLDLTCDDYFYSRWNRSSDNELQVITEKYRNLIKNRQ
ncbi:(p)ppGpp synthetase [Pectobacterium odoriferum]|uniref:GTP pyrophosphokinase n=1 Tax=Pectobacterium odoriferum TaxID=78398 RepID=UPI001373B681|nr:(p)ppGpp synthetase [Pectobacterium odoriferum]QHP81439.1 (p)ppGpp synthetase [Pectobacterium odoriferum]